jgi:hypothetical protein
VNQTDEFRIKLLTILRERDGRRVAASEVIEVGRQVGWAADMRNMGWLGVVTANGVKWVWITREGRRALKCLERLFR